MSYVIDASAVLALLRDEPGAARVEELLGEADSASMTAAVISTLNLAELHQKFGDHLPESLIGQAGSVIASAPFTDEHAKATGALHEATKSQGLSLADRACLALAKSLDLPVITADRQWAKVKAGVKLELIR
jgi:PIN domain nuclease of toxin-antitoxin system